MPFVASSPRSSPTPSIASTAGGPGVSSPPTPRRRFAAPPSATWTGLVPERGSKNSNTNTCADSYAHASRLDARRFGQKEAFHERAGSGSEGGGRAGDYVPDSGLPGSGGRHRLVVPGLQLRAAGDHAG